MDLRDSTPEEIVNKVAALRTAFDEEITADLDFRRQQIIQLRTLIQRGRPRLEEALWKDLHKHPQEATVTEFSLLFHEIQTHLDNLTTWTKPEKVGTDIGNLPGTSYLRKDPLGVVCIIGVWNYPIILTLQPVVGALSAGNCVLLRLPPNDTCGNVTKVMEELIAEYMDPRVIRTITGGIEVSKCMLQQKYDLIFATGSEVLGKVVAEAAAKTLTPIVLELGGKSPSIVDKNCNLPVVVKRLVWGTFCNSGQTCVRPDYVLVDARIGDELVKEVEKTCKAFYGDDAQASNSYGRVINEKSFNRLSEMLNKDRSYVTFGGETDPAENYIAPTLLNFKRDLEAFEKCASMQGEIFGPILPIYYYESVDEVFRIIKKHEKPLALYVNSEDSKFQEHVVSRTTSGGVTVNDSLVHLTNSHLPFGGVGGSGQGAYHGKYSFDTFSHTKACLVKKTILDVEQRYGPYSEKNNKLMNTLLTPIPSIYFTTAKYIFVSSLAVAAYAVLQAYM